MLRVFFIVASVLIFQVASASSESSSSSDEVDLPNVVKVTNENFKDIVLRNDSGIVFIRAHLPYCRACREFAYAWNKVGHYLKDISKVCDIDCELNNDSCSYYLRSNRFPEFIVFENGKKINKWRGSYSGWGLVDYIKNKEYLP